MSTADALPLPIVDAALLLKSPPTPVPGCLEESSTPFSTPTVSLGLTLSYGKTVSDVFTDSQPRTPADASAEESPLPRVSSFLVKIPASEPTAAAATADATAAAARRPAQQQQRTQLETPLLALISTYATMLVLYYLGRGRDLYRRFFPSKKQPQVAQVLAETTPEDVVRRAESARNILAKTPAAGYAPLLGGFDAFFQRRIYRRVKDCVNRPIDSRPSRVIGVMERESADNNATFSFTGRIVPAVNLGSYNYLGFAEDTPSITHDVLDCIDDLGVASCSAPHEAGQNAPVAALEKAVAAFLGKDDAVVCGMGFGTNFKGLPALFGKGTLCVSDNLNHSSLVNGVRSSGAKVQVFQHGDYAGLEKVVREAVVLGQDPMNNLTAYKPWERIVIIVEGIYSMEGEIVDLPAVVEIKKKYKALLYVDEAHSVGAIGSTGRGVCEHCGVDPKDVDVLMGTFTKSFGAIGGYIAADQHVIDYVRKQSCITLHCDTLAPPCAQQIVSVLNVLCGRDGTDLGKKRIAQLKANSEFFRQELVKMGLVVLGDDASPVIPVIVFNVAKLAVLLRESLRRGVAVVGATYPATAAAESRIRFCVSAVHTREDLQHCLDVMKELSEEVFITYHKTA